jgi:hypothetical protein
VPIVGWPAKPISARGVKMRTRQSCRPSSAGTTNVVSEKPNSAAIACITGGARPPASGRTASWLPPNRLSVNTSRMWNGWRIAKPIADNRHNRLAPRS